MLNNVGYEEEMLSEGSAMATKDLFPSSSDPNQCYLWESSQNQILKEESGVHRSDRQIHLISSSTPEGIGFAPLVHLTRKSFINDINNRWKKPAD